MVIHPIGVGKLLEEYGCDDNVVAAGYLHDVVEDTKYTIQDIEREFGKDIANLVSWATEPNKSLPWEERKEHTIKAVKKLPIRNKLLICADKINNLEDLMLIFQKSGKRDFSAFKRGEQKQSWYYTSIYNSLIYGEDENNAMFKRLKDVLDIVFYKKENNYLKDIIFKDNMEYYESLKKLHAQKVELKKLNDLIKLKKPYIIEFSGTPRTGKTTLINNLYDFFKKGGFNITLIEEFTTSDYYKKYFSKKISGLSKWDSNIAIVEEVKRQLLKSASLNDEIVLIDRSVNDRQIWNYRIFNRGLASIYDYLESKEYYLEFSKKYIDSLVVSYALPEVSLKRDYINSLSLEERRFLNIDNIDEYNKCLMEIKDLLNESSKCTLLIDTSYKSINDIAVYVASNIMKSMRDRYIDAFKEEMSKYIY